MGWTGEVNYCDPNMPGCALIQIVYLRNDGSGLVGSFCRDSGVAGRPFLRRDSIRKDLIGRRVEFKILMHC